MPGSEHREDRAARVRTGGVPGFGLRAALAGIACVVLPLSAGAGGFGLSLPIDCTPGDGCHIQNYVDHDPGDGKRDYRCGGLSYDGHTGTDFALPTRAALRAGVDVLAAAPGVVTAIRDGMADTGADMAAGDIEGRECGNGVRLSHADGYETQYCHLARMSVAVRVGQAVDRGDRLGRVGMSGLTQFPHLHLTLRRNGAVIDPFAPAASGCGGNGQTLWQTPPAYVAGGMLEAGFAPALPGYDAIRDGTAARPAIPAGADALVLFGYAFGGRTGDRMTLRIDGPQGILFDQAMVLDREQARFFRAGGKRRNADRWAPGLYTGTVRLLREGEEIGRMQTRTTIR
ncbi:M23 family metallopeptidase [Pukyongiella litopenaei]|uniref:M23 family metallopeptidase n=1 Tax=Pukyongiella litopenaei TaxID=2605946 RepID=A0A2S0MUU4_9RHOB|nr:M23 family metallopeptidase [Pukyongiella litopenaei]AVO39645.1 M23 family metallopeptidase [Pukyongiella litopenaei]